MARNCLTHSDTEGIRQIANYRLWLDASKLRQDAWEVVHLPDKDIEAYRAALAKAHEANSLNPNNPDILMVLGVAQYRVGLYEETLSAFKRLTELTELKAKKTPTSSWGLAMALFKAMALHQLDRVDEAESTLDEVRALLKDDRFAKNEGLQTLLAEVEGLIAGTEP